MSVQIPEGYMTVADVVKKIGLRTDKRIRDDIKAGLLPAKQIRSQGRAAPFLILPEDADKYIQDWHTPKPVVPCA